MELLQICLDSISDGSEIHVSDIPLFVCRKQFCFLRSPYFAIQFLCIYSAVFADYVARLLRAGAVPAGMGGDSVAGAGVVLFLRLLGYPLCAAAVRLDLLELLVRETDRVGCSQADSSDGRSQREYRLAGLFQIYGILFGDNQRRSWLLL